MANWLVLTSFINPRYLDIFSGLVDWWQKSTNSGDYDPSKLKKVTEALQNAAPYLHYDDFMGRLLNQFKWGVVKFFYGLANWASELATDSLNFSGILKSSGLNNNLINGVMGIAAGLMILTLTWVGIKIGTSSKAPQLKNVVWQLAISAFLIGNIQPITNWVVDQSTGVYKGFVEADNSKGTSSLPYQIVQANSNDLLAIVANNFSGFKINNGDTNTKWEGVSKDKNGEIKDQRQKDVHYGSFEMNKSDFDTATSGDLSTTISADLAKKLSNKANKSKEKPAWDPDNLRYKLAPTGVGTKSNDQGKAYSGYFATKVDQNNTAFFKIFNGGYERYSVQFLPVIIALISMTIAFLLVTFVSVRAFLELAIMQVLSIIIFSTDLETGKRTKAAVQDIFSSALLIAFQGFELAFYRIAAIWMSSSDAGQIHDNAYLYAVGMIALTWALWEGSSKVQKFFGLDTGLKQGWTKVAGGIAAAEYIAHNGKNTAKGAINVARGTGKAAGAIAGEAQAWEAGNSTKATAKENGASNSEARQAGSYARRAYRSAHRDFIQNGGNAMDWNRAVNSGAVAETVQDEAARMSRNGGLTDNQYNSLHHNPYMQNRVEKNGGSAAPTGVGSDTSFVGNPNYRGKKDTASTVTSAGKDSGTTKDNSVKTENIQNQGLKTEDNQPKANVAKESTSANGVKSTDGTKTSNDGKVPDTTVSEATNSLKSDKKETANEPKANSTSPEGSRYGQTTAASSINDELPSLSEVQHSTNEVASQQHKTDSTQAPKPVGESGRHLSDIVGQDSSSTVTETAGTNHINVERKPGRTEISTHDTSNQGMSSVSDAMKSDSTSPISTHRVIESQGSNNTVDEIRHNKTTINHRVENQNVTTETNPTSTGSTNAGTLAHGDSKRKDD
ncbi:hypothetical protein EJK17_03220 [Lactobacillus xujianguonis]|uniref:DUF8208 domain-containing protein n=1 Tax=Lactobacillus xujianguonis TaxID=2495899 RepID=A0A437SWB6_9LACO|nr:hypothetical protein [Lactobacillus xujianguonis]RVU71221.1 hypothetical protein EJK17_03220 [Lactobacillus xujianguonis]